MPVQTLVNKVPGKQVPLLKSRPSVRQFKLSRDGLEDSSSDLHQWFRRKQSVWPTEAVSHLHHDKDQTEEILQVLTAHDPQAASNLVEFSFRDKSFIPIVEIVQNICLLEVHGSCLHVEIQEAREQLAGLDTGAKATAVVKENENYDLDDSANDVSKAGEDEESIEEIDDDESKDTRYDKDEIIQLAGVRKTKKLMNQFNFCERATITYENTLKDLGTETKPPARATFSDYVSQWIIYDSYQKDTKIQEQEKEIKGKKEKSSATSRKNEFRKKSSETGKEIANSNIIKKALILERMINQNMFNDILQDFRYYEDPSDEFRNNEGTLLPLWKFHYSNTIKKLSITDIKWNPRYYDLFAVSFGCFDFQKQHSSGYFCLWSLKNPSIPEYISNTQSGVMTLDFHARKSYLIAVGMYNGMVAVYDFRFPNRPAIYESSNVDNKHTGIVWQVQWDEDLNEGELTFYSISSDGRVLNWTLMKNQLVQTLVINVVPARFSNSVKTDEKLYLKDSGTCIALHPNDHSIFLIGTEEGHIYKCSTAYLSMYLFVYEAHHMPVHCIDYNKYSCNIFASCSADWTIKIWEDERKEPLFVFDTASSVEDVKWAPYSSTVMAAVSLDCKTYVFDLNVDKYKSICTQTIASRKTSTLMKITFNWKLPIIVIGDDKGLASIFKLSPNLRIKPKLTKKQQGVDLREIEIQKLNKLLSLIREPAEMKNFTISNNTDTSSV